MTTDALPAAEAARRIGWILPLAGTEIRLLSREWGAMLFAFVMPPLMLLVLGGVFGDQPDEGFGGVLPSDYYVAAYLAIPMAALALVGLPVMLASYRERDVLRRFDAFGVAPVRVVLAQALVTCGLIVLAAVVVLVVAAPTYGIPSVGDPVRVVAAFALSMATMVVLGVVLGLASGSARSAQALGMLTFLPMWLLGGGGPPVGVLSDAMRTAADLLPLSHVTAAVREPWLGLGTGTGHLVVLAGWLAVGLVVTATQLRRQSS